MIRDNIRNDVKVTLDSEPTNKFKIDTVAFGSYSEDQLNDICYYTNNIIDSRPQFVAYPIPKFVNHNGMLYGVTTNHYSSNVIYLLTPTSVVNSELSFSITEYHASRYMNALSITSYKGLIYIIHKTDATSSSNAVTSISTWDTNTNTINLVIEYLPFTGGYSGECGFVVCNEILYILRWYLGSDNTSSNVGLYKIDVDNTCTRLSTSPNTSRQSSQNAIVYNNMIHVFTRSSFGSYNPTHYIVDGTTWTTLNTVPYTFSSSNMNSRYVSAYVYHNNIFYNNYIWSEEDDTWTKLNITDNENKCTSIVAISDTEVHAIIYDSTNNNYKHYRNPGNTYKHLKTKWRYV